MALIAGRGALALLVLLTTTWGALALYFRGPAAAVPAALVVGGWVAFGIATLGALGLPAAGEWRAFTVVVFALAFAALWFWWSQIEPQHDRDWAPEVARLLDAEADGNRVRLHNVRNFDWRTCEDFTPRWETREYDLAALASVDLIVSYWMGPHIAHTLVSFGFADGRQLVFSVEVHRTRGQVFSTLGGLFKQSELVLVAADERDIVRTRSNIRDEDVYIYRVALPKPAMRELFKAYVREAIELKAQPRFYNTLFSNCTTLVFDMVNAIVPGLPKDIRLLLSGHLPEYIYDLGALDTSRPFSELRRRGHINERAIAADAGGRASADFPAAIRCGIPAPNGELIGNAACATRTGVAAGRPSQ